MYLIMKEAKYLGGRSPRMSKNTMSCPSNKSEIVLYAKLSLIESFLSVTYT